MCLLDRGLRVAERVGDSDGDVITVEEDEHEYVGHRSYMCCVSSSCCPWRRRYLCRAKSPLQFCSKSIMCNVIVA